MSLIIKNGVEYAGGSSSHEYSTTEQVVGTWIDGRPVYEKLFIMQEVDLEISSFHMALQILIGLYLVRVLIMTIILELQELLVLYLESKIIQSV